MTSPTQRTCSCGRVFQVLAHEPPETNQCPWCRLNIRLLSTKKLWQELPKSGPR